jgi:ribosomal protein S18 acetylase RimI-like enzyme
MDTITLYRPVGPAELDLIRASGWERFPARLPEQPIFYPVLNEAYATQIARDWNAKRDGGGYVTRFRVSAAFARRYEVRRVGAAVHEELWVPADELSAFNENIVGRIEVIAEFAADAGPERPLQIRLAHASDASAVARLHTDSWRRHYRGAYSDRYLDGDLYAERLRTWTGRMTGHDADSFTLLAEHRDRAVGFAHVMLDADPTWGALVDNLHVAHAVQRGGIGTVLLDRVARIVIERRPGSPIFLWVLEPNEAAQGFYVSRRGTLGDRVLATPPGGDARNLDGAPRKIRVTWPDPAWLLLPEPRASHE